MKMYKQVELMHHLIRARILRIPSSHSTFRYSKYEYSVLIFFACQCDILNAMQEFTFE